MQSPASISSATLESLQTLHRQTTGPFTVAEAAAVLDLDATQARRLLAYLVERGWLTRVRHGLYATVPMEATDAATWQQDAWVIAARSFAPCYVGGWSACEHWGLTDQMFREIIVMTSRALRQRRPTIQGIPFRLTHRAPEMLFGTRGVWRDGVRIEVSDPSRTLLDVLDSPDLAGGIRHVADIVAAYLADGFRDDALWIGYAERLGNRSVFKRLGYLIEARGLDALDLAEACRQRQSTGITTLDPTAPARGPITKRWNLRLNVTVIDGTA